MSLRDTAISNLTDRLQNVASSHVSGSLVVGDGLARIDFIMGVPFRSIAGDEVGEAAVEMFVGMVATGFDFEWVPAPESGFERTRNLTWPPKELIRAVIRYAAQKPAGSLAPSPVPPVATASPVPEAGAVTTSTTVPVEAAPLSPETVAQRGPSATPPDQPIAELSGAPAPPAPAAEVEQAAERPARTADSGAGATLLAQSVRRLPTAREIEVPGGHTALALLAVDSPAYWLHITTPDLEAILVIVDQRPVGGLATVGGSILRADAAVKAALVASDAALVGHELPRDLAEWVAGLWGFEHQVEPIQSRWVQGLAYVRGLARPHQRGFAFAVKGDAWAGVAFAGGHLRYQWTVDDPRPREVAAEGGLFADPDSRIEVRLELLESADDGEQPSGAGQSSAAPEVNGSKPPQSAPDGRDREVEEARSEIVAFLQEEFRQHSGQFIVLFEQADPSIEGYKAAANQIPTLKPRLVSGNTLEMAREHVMLILGQDDL